MPESESNADVVDPAPGVPSLEGRAPAAHAAVAEKELIPPFRPGPEPTGAWKRRWALGIGGWAIVVTAAYTTLGVHLNPYLSLTGLLVGFLVGLTGMGGGALMTPILIFFFGFQPTMAIGTDVTYAKNNYGDLINGILYRAIGSALMMIGVLLIVKVVMHVDQKHRRENIKMTARLKVMTVCLGLGTGFIICLLHI